MSQAGLFDDVTPSVAPHRLVLASAGTGKTFELSLHYAALLLVGVEARRILATTFTRKAAGEIFDRVLLRLREGGAETDEGASKRALLLAAVQRFDPTRRSVEAAECRAVLARLARRLDAVQVRTLDAFFVRLARLFAMELEIAPEWSVADEVEETALVAEGVARVLEHAEDEERLELVRGLTRAAALGAQSGLQAMVSKADAIAREALDGAWGRIEPLEPTPDDEIAAARAVVLGAEPPKTKKGAENKNWAKQLGRLRALCEVSDGERYVASAEFLDDGLVKKVLDGESTYYAHEIPEPLADALRVLVRTLLESEVGAIIERNAATERFLARYAAADVALRAERGAYRFAGFPRALERGPVRRGRDEWTTELGYRLDGRIDHLLLDEFQDTSPLQWRLLLPLVDEVLGDGTGERSFFCVGDVKQSIYGWRGGEPRLLSRMAERHPVLGDRTESRSASFRSSQTVLDAVNDVFAGLAERRAFEPARRAAARAAAEEWMCGFEPHRAVREGLAGEARVWQVRPYRKNEKESPIDPSIELAIERVTELYESRPGASIAILVRARSEVPRLRFLLGQEGIEASDEGGNPLTDALAVRWILGLLHLADHPGDGVAALQVARSPFAERLGLVPGEVGTEEGWAAASTVARDTRAALVERGYGPTCEGLARELLDEAPPWDARRLEQLVDLAYAFDERAGLRPIDFVDLVRGQRVPDPAASRVKVMTIHASKGLEFDIVVLPELARRIDLQPDEYIAERETEVDAPILATARPSRRVADAHPRLQAVYADEERRSTVDALSALYVAMTRAKHCLEMIVGGPASKGVGLSHGSIVGEAFGAQLDGKWAHETSSVLVWEHAESTSTWAGAASADGGETHVHEPPLALIPGRARAGTSGAARRPSGAHEAVHGAAALLAEQGRGGSRLGTLVHALFEGFTWIEDDARNDDALRAELLRRAPDVPGLVDAAVERFRSALASPGLEPLLRRPEGTTRVLHERSLDVDVTDADGVAVRWSGAIDRLVLTLEEGRVVRASIVDFKTDARASADEVLRAHGAQLRAYRDAVVALFSLPPDAVECTIAWLGAADGTGGVALTVD
ncbi:MAG: UvrD-helicase domain-containing protein [Planctomycetota bacterium]